MATANDVMRIFDQRSSAIARMANAKNELAALDKAARKAILLMAGDICENTDAAFYIGGGFAAVVLHDEDGRPTTRIVEFFDAIEEQKNLEDGIREATSGPPV